MKTNYLSTVYNPESHPYTTYPEKLCKHLYDRFNFDKEMSLLEVGCGRGEFLRNFKNLGLSVYGCDLSDEVKDYLKDFDIKITDVDKQPLPYNDNSIDIIFSKSFIEHLYYPENFLKEAMRILKPGGLLLTLTPDWESNYKIFFDDFTHRSPFTKTALKDAYKMTGYNSVDVFHFRQLPIVWKFPILNIFCAFISPFIPVRTSTKFLRWSRELMLVGIGKKD